MSYGEINDILNPENPRRVRARALPEARFPGRADVVAYIDGVAEYRQLVDLALRASSEGDRVLAKEVYDEAGKVLHVNIPFALSRLNGFGGLHDVYHIMLERLERDLEEMHHLILAGSTPEGTNKI